jgi:hypothetical protein
MKVSDIEYVLEQLGSDGSYGRSGDHLMTNCVNAPWGHNSGQDDTRKMGVLVQEGVALVKCFYPGCYSGGTLLQLVQEVGGKRVGAGLMTPEELSNLKAYIILAEEDEDDESDEWKKPKGAPKPVPAPILAELGTGSAYYESRGFTTQILKDWGFGEVLGRAFFPLKNEQGEIIGVQGRLLPGLKEDQFLQPMDAKFRNFPTFLPKSEHLFGEHLAKKPLKYLMVVESPTDAVLMNQFLEGYNIDEALCVATLGGEFSQAQAEKLVKYVAIDGEIIIAMDNDPAGKLAQRGLVDVVRTRHRQVLEITWPQKDPGECSIEELEQAWDSRESWLIRRLTKRIP